MDGQAIHRCLHVLDLEKSIAFYEKALGIPRFAAWGPEDCVAVNVFMWAATPRASNWNSPGTAGRSEPLRQRRPRLHLAFTVDDYEAARALHEEMGCICHVNEAMGLYFIEDPDGCWLEILPNKAEFAPQAGVDVLDAMARRRSLRRCSGEPVPQALLDRILRRGCARHRGARGGRGNSSSSRPSHAGRSGRMPRAGRGHAHWSRRGHRRAWPTRRAPTPGWKTAPSSWPICHLKAAALRRGQLDSGPSAPGGRRTLDPRVRREPPEGASSLPAGGHPLPRYARSRSPASALR
ncbi:MAG: VOC family protein [Adlercreutzia equolifaciens]